jgi:hypothetical protein
LRQFQLLGDLVQGLLLDQVGAQARQVAFGQVVEAFVQDRGDDAVQDRIAEEFEALVMQTAVATVGQRLLQQAGFPERVTQASLQ